MKKIPTLFERLYEGRRVVGITAITTSDVCEEAFLKGTATIKIDGSCCAIIDGEFYKRYDAKKGKQPPEGAIPCCDPDPITGHWPHWVKVDPNNPGDKWFIEALLNYKRYAGTVSDGTYEAVGPHFNGNPHGFTADFLDPHGTLEIEVKRTFNGVRQYLTDNYIEGIVFWYNGEPVCKIKRSDFGLPWGRNGGTK